MTPGGPGAPDPWASGARAVSGEFASDGPAVVADAGVVAVSSRYELRDEIGVGGMGRVTRAWDTVLLREVAIKEVRSTHVEVLRARLRREAEVTAGLEHPSIVPIYDAGVSDAGVPWYAMRIVRGQSLHDALVAEPDLRGRLRWVRHVLAASEAMAYAHKRGVLHRDLKPANVLVGDFGETQVMDWGLAVRLGEVEPVAVDGDGGDGRLTRLGSVVGSPAWMSPEQARGEALTAASDVFSLGAILFEVLSGHPPHDGDSAQAVLAVAREGRSAELSRFDDDAPPELRAIVRKAMAKEAEDRYPSAAELASDLTAWLEGRAVSAHVYTPAELLRRLVNVWRVPLIVGGVALVVLAGVLTASAIRLQRESRATAAAAELAEDNFAGLLAREARVAAEEDDRVGAEVLAVEALLRREDPDARGVLARYGFAPRPRRLSTAALPVCDGPWLALDGTVVVCPRADAVEGYGLDGALLWRTPAQIVASGVSHDRDAALITLTARPFTPTTLLRIDARSGAVVGSKPWFSMVPVSAENAAGDQFVLFGPFVWVFRADERFEIIPSSGDHFKTVVEAPDGVFAWRQPGHLDRWHDGAGAVVTSPDDLEAVVDITALDDHTLLAASLQGRLFVLDADTLRLLRTAQSPVGGLRRVVVGPHQEVALLGDEGVAVGRSDPYFSPEKITSGVYADAAWMPDGRQLHLVGRTVDVYEVNVNGGVHAHLEPEGLTTAAVSPDGTRVAVYGSDALGWMWSVAEGRIEPLPRVGATVVKDAAWSRDGAEVAVALAPPTLGKALSVWDGAQGTYRRLDQGVGGAARVGPFGPGRWWAYTWDRTIDLYDSEGRYARIATDWLSIDAEPVGVSSFVVSSDDGQLFWHEGDEDQPLVRITAVDHLRSVDATDDGQRFVGADPETTFVFTRAGEQVAALTEPGMHPTDVALSPDGALVAVGDILGVLRVWSVADGVLRMRARGHTLRIGDVEFSDDGRSIYTASWDHSARRWDVGAISADPAAVRREVEDAWASTLQDVLAAR